MLRWWLVLVVTGCQPRPEEGEACVSPEENLGLVCNGGSLFWCIDEAWVDIGPLYSDDCIGDCSEDPIQECSCNDNDEVVCVDAN